MKYKFFKAHTLLMSLVFLITSCVKESSIGEQVLTDDDLLGSYGTDTISVLAKNILMDSLITNRRQIVMVGEVNDEDFGVSRLSFACQANLPGNNFDFGSNATFDSIALYLKYESIYGVEDYTHNWEVFKLGELMEDDNDYFPNDPPILGNSLGNFIIEPNVEDSALVVNNYEQGVLSIRLSDDLGLEIFNESGSANLASDDAFHDFFNGIMVKSTGSPSVNDGSVVRFDLHNSDSRLVIFYSNDNGSNLTAEFPINSTTNSGIFIEREQDQSLQLVQQLNDTISQYDSYYLSSFHGAKLRLEFPYLQEYAKNDSVSIAYARLVLPKSRLSSPFANAGAIWLLGVSSNDYEATVDDENYYIEITDYLQNFLNGVHKKNYLELAISDYFDNISRTIVNGSTNADPLRLEVTFTQF